MKTREHWILLSTGSLVFFSCHLAASGHNRSPSSPIMKTPIRLAILAFSLITTLFTLTTQIFTSSSYSASSALLQSRGYLPQSILSWANYGENDNGTSSTTSETIMSLEEKHEIEKSRIKAELERIEKGWSKPEKGQEDKIIIMGKMHDDYTDWVEKELPEYVHLLIFMNPS